MIYKNKFIALYDQDDVCVCIANNWYELAEYLDKSISAVQSSLSHILRKKDGVNRSHFNCRGKKLTPYLFDVEDEEDEINEIDKFGFED